MSTQPENKQLRETPEVSVIPQQPSVPPLPIGQTAVSGRRQAFDDVLRPLTPEDLASPGTQKIILYMLQQTQSENELLTGYVERFHDADKRAAILQQQNDAERAERYKSFLLYRARHGICHATISVFIA